MKHVENPQAFPVPEQRALDGAGLVEGHPGMTLRDWFAGRALGGMMASQGLLTIYANNAGVDAMQHSMAADAYKLADAMLAARQESGS